ncbi:acyl carrier protein [Anabaena cylindrica FACHB-243]|uniref:Phosphopantetheine-binding protein n=1 Tax=Anabaena cylindrica (strain ATCC 27899 / PCC 7122) TaxID=272123 RepID=K9ZJF9_ANACC|nr:MULTISPECIES: acyl carrier protein [Anabaena]AFZ58475.1 phosphopantetheine-binding protein [Anabaena cylindrica PCC 7122]MBD2417303.1 acyl carrier protein [Anabaena cylindrica FACHB-243]MBY5281424.1 acyl carrier protein [Anabaena sp. CCAP 1446/1C]MBY5310185.1 acyl carrier protein [Anabaena sp. CCAP 1446/1C]MCM2410134.1 acyl carrier protein [Anabaena sp. CCAP 1446/1C]
MSQNISNSQPKKPYSVADIEAWFVSNVAYMMGVNPEEIDIREPLDSYGLDSAQAMLLASKAEKYLGLKLPLIHLWNYPTIEELSQRLAEELENSQSEILQM